MRVLTTRFVLGALVLGTLCLLAETAEGGPFRRRGRAVADPCCPSYGGGYAMAYPARGYAVAQGGYGVGYSTTYGAGYASNPCWPAAGGIAPGGGYYSQPGYGAGYGGVAPAGGFPAPMPGTGGTAVPANAEKVRMTDNVFEPATLNITVGTTVRWTNEGKNPHTVTSDKGTWGSGDIPPGGEFTATFTKAGTFDYHCKHHKDMKGTIVVK